MNVLQIIFRVINGGKSKTNEDQATSKQFFIKKKSAKNGMVLKDIPLSDLGDDEQVNRHLISTEVLLRK